MENLLKQPPKARHILRDLVPNDERFPEHVPQLVDDLAELLKIQRDRLDNSMDSLTLIERKVKRLGREKCIQPPIFAGLVAYTGEVIRKAVGGEWEMYLSKMSQMHDEHWEPWIIDPQGRSTNMFVWLYDMLTDSGIPISIGSATSVAIGTRRLRPTTAASATSGMIVLHMKSPQ